VFATHADPERARHVANLTRPGGNMTGLADIQTLITPKRLEILRATVTRATRFGVLWTPTAPSGAPFVQAAEETGGKLGVHLLTVSVKTAAEFDAAFARMAQGRVGGVLVHSAALTARDNGPFLAEVALKHGLPTMFGNRENVVAGGLMRYGPDHLDLTRRAAVYIDKILKGADPGDLPVEQASKYYLLINLKTARALGLTIPPSILARADEVIE
jgi:putative ABC transport system substrate-binding protein